MSRHNELMDEIQNMQVTIDKKDAELRLLQRNAEELADHRQNLTRSVHDNTANIHMLEVRLFFVNCLCVCMYVCWQTTGRT